MSHTVSTDTVSPELRLEYWSKVVQDHFVPFDMSTQAPRSAFSGTIVAHADTTIRLAEVIANGHVATHPTQGKLRSDDDVFLLLVQRRGFTLVEQAGRNVLMREGALVLCDGGRAYRMTTPESLHHDVLMIPGNLLRRSLKFPERYSAVEISGTSGAGRLLAGFIGALRKEILGELESGSEGAVQNAVVELLCGALVASALPPPDDDGPQSSSLRRYHLHRLRNYVQAHLANPDLSIDRIGAGLQLSKRHLHALFEGQPTTLNAWIWKERLHAARCLLANPSHARQPITEIAFSVGFKSSAHFSRLFLATFGMSPRDFRAMTQATGAEPSR